MIRNSLRVTDTYEYYMIIEWITNNNNNKIILSIIFAWIPDTDNQFLLHFQCIFYAKIHFHYAHNGFIFSVTLALIPGIWFFLRIFLLYFLTRLDMNNKTGCLPKCVEMSLKNCRFDNLFFQQSRSNSVRQFRCVSFKIVCCLFLFGVAFIHC